MITPLLFSPLWCKYSFSFSSSHVNNNNNNNNTNDNNNNNTNDNNNNNTNDNNNNNTNDNNNNNNNKSVILYISISFDLFLCSFTLNVITNTHLSKKKINPASKTVL